jgi:hypothetical protein
MATRTKMQPLVQITNLDFAARYEEEELPCYADCAFRTDLGRVETVRAMLTEYAVEMGLSEQQLRCCMGFIIGILSRGEQGKGTWASCLCIFSEIPTKRSK